ncbi:hypothetical protein MKW92_050378 [Papaver armeniacum]|nr:hypothetical protein MKW92_050378 [Papaver armeniacum]
MKKQNLEEGAGRREFSNKLKLLFLKTQKMRKRKRKKKKKTVYLDDYGMCGIGKANNWIKGERQVDWKLLHDKLLEQNNSKH